MNNHNKIKQAFENIKAPDNMAERILSGAENKTTENPRRNHKLIRVALVAAISVLMTVTVLAVVVPEVLSGKFYAHEKDNSFLVLSTKNHSFSDEFREYINNTPSEHVDSDVDMEDLPRHWFDKRFYSLEEAADFFKVPLISSDKLYSALYNEIGIDTWIIYHAKEDFARITLSAAVYLNNDNDYVGQIAIRLKVDDNPDEFGDRDMGMVFASNEIIESYTSPANGIETLITENAGTFFGEPRVTLTIHFSVNDVMYSIQTPHFDKTDNNMEIHKNILWGILKQF